MKAIATRGMIVLVTLVITSRWAIAVEVGLNLAAGYAPYAVLQTDESLAMQYAPVTGGVDLYFNLSSGFALGMGVVSHFSQLSFKKKGLSYSGSYSAAGGTLSLNFAISTNYQLQLYGEGLANGTLTAKGVESATVNGEAFKHSTLYTYTGNPAALGRVAIVKKRTDNQLSKYEYLRLGMSIEVLTQTFATEARDVATNSDNGPRDKVIRSAGYSMTCASVSFIVGFVM